jgi:hypothetical protein
MAVIEGAIPRNAVRQAVATGAAAGNITVTGIKTRDTLVSVLFVDATDASEAVANRTSEFTITATNTINNAGGTTGVGGFYIITWLSVG